jgi:hypothetical protein
MTEGTCEDQKARTLAPKPEEIISMGFFVWTKRIVTNMTKKLSLWRDNNE